ncbi:uncharacterized protein FOMMEDRAFT_155948 [Fomitiporia mediterranea MF3/22]|uniref:uncharacterized protein n=1 Tax=Fomitiporia mediterranea (strain MF3/22) TaxID=694068 RepID=UPI0004408CF4|nr:uncharacterized protein FOMMEDRAFT_155948 [Fomitiporia mediterranea MF3/22]EJD02627.1 hypothetical protein FOMMEDRAFT_155948 [Fomitiporia mediterranea MF3/22]
MSDGPLPVCSARSSDTVSARLPRFIASTTTHHSDGDAESDDPHAPTNPNTSPSTLQTQ